MQKNLMRAALAAVGAMAAGISHAECNGSGCWEVYVQELYPEAAGGAWIQTTGNETLANCAADSGIFLRLSGTTPGYKELYATLLAAQLADKKVHIRIHEGSNPCSIAYVRLYRET
jgi:hypothetical protein